MTVANNLICSFSESMPEPFDRKTFATIEEYEMGKCKYEKSLANKLKVENF